MRPSVEISVVEPNSTITSLGKFPATERYYKGTGLGPRHLGRQTTLGIGSHSVYVGTGDAFEVAQFSFRGERMSPLREARAPRPVTKTEVKTYVRDAIRRARRANTSSWAQYFSELEWPKVYPAYGKLMVDAMDHLWIEEYPIPGTDMRDWTVYSKGGTKLAMVTLPRNFRVLEAGGSWILGVWRDELDVDYVRIYSLVKEASPVGKDGIDLSPRR